MKNYLLRDYFDLFEVIEKKPKTAILTQITR